ncbi:energy transducer TonB [Epilithonimonas lactis]|uniref:Energy transducer TonB n=1 Tax=Epilithonimonas lactis TaxID=421072 RepID=A0A085BEC9_9FLAO|nr:energy transducer TonB [Epilithonimonas lactis]KFC20824.1 energy transducer TonB [Epilithonimonas lactis]SEP62859.1 protein TonB [Epilithonimonas lactis]
MADENLKYDLSLDEIVFENRNKEYGAYDLRTRYPNVLTKSFLIGTAFFILLAVSPLIYLKIQQMNAKDKVEVDANLVNILEEQPILEQPKEEEPPPPPPPKEEEKQEVIQNVVPEPKKAPKIETPPPPITKQLETTTGLNNQEGVKTPTYTPPPPPPGTGKVVTAEVKPVTNEVYESVDQAAEYPGGINSFRNKFQNNFDSGSLEGEGTLKTEVTFVVEKDGSLTQVKASGSNSDFNKEAEATVKGLKTKWTPGKVNGQPVRSRFRFPVTMNFQ